MAAGKILLQKASGGVTTITGVDGTGATELQIPESGTLAKTSDINTSGVELKTISTGTATFTAITNNINLTGIGLGVEIGDVIQITGANDSKNNSEFTIEVITDDNNVIVNQAHTNKGTSKNVATRSGDTGVTVKLLAKWYNASIGMGQGIVDVTASRAYGVPYPNNTNRTIQVYPSSDFTGSGSVTLTLDSIDLPSIFGQVGGFIGRSVSFGTIPKGSTYQAAGNTLSKWVEIR
jgi:hypothetical protein